MIKLKTLANFSEYYIKQNLSKVDCQRFQKDKGYAQKMFFHYWAFERANAPRGFRVAAIKVIDDVDIINNSNMEKILQKYFHGKENKKNNPLLDKRILDFKIHEIITKIKNGELENAFNGLALNGINHKIRSFFIRDCLYLLGKEDIVNKDVEKYLFAFPVDIWVEKTLEYIFGKPSSKQLQNILPKKYGNLENKKINLAVSAITQCFKEKVSPLRLNMGIWYYCANFVADGVRLEELLKKGDEAVKDEMKPFKVLFRMKARENNE